MVTLFDLSRVFISSFDPSLLNKNLEDCVRSTRVFVHGCVVDGSAFCAYFEQLMELILRFHIDLSKAIHKNPCLRIFSQFKVLARLILTEQRGGGAHALPDRRMGSCLLFMIWS